MSAADITRWRAVSAEPLTVECTANGGRTYRVVLVNFQAKSVRVRAQAGCWRLLWTPSSRKMTKTVEHAIQAAITRASEVQP